MMIPKYGHACPRVGTIEAEGVGNVVWAGCSDNEEVTRIIWIVVKMVDFLYFFELPLQ